MNALHTLCLIFASALALFMAPVGTLQANAGYVTLSGYITQQNSGKQPLAGANVYADSANITTTDSDGYFELQFINRRAGDRVLLHITLPGMEVINTESLWATIPHQEAPLPLSLYMAPEGQVEENALSYYKINTKVIEQAYQDTLAILEARADSSWQALKTLDSLKNILWNQRQAAHDYAWEMSEKFARVNLDDADTIYREAFAHFTQGHYQQAQEVLQNANLWDKLKDVRKEIGRIDTLKQELRIRWDSLRMRGSQYADAAVLKAKLHVNKFQFPKAYEAYEWALQFDSTNFQNWFDYAVLLSNQNKDLKALTLYRYILNSQKITPDNLSTILNNMGNIYTELNFLDSALMTFQQAIRIKSANEPNQIKKPIPSLASTFSNLGSLYRKLNQYDSAFSYYRRSLKHHIPESTSQSEEHLNGLAIIYYNLGTSYNDLNQYDSALITHSKARDIRVKLSIIHFEKYAPDLASSFHNLGLLHKNFKHYDSALSLYNKARVIRDKITKINPQRYAKDLASTLNNLGNLYCDLIQYDSALNVYNRAITEYNTLYAENPQKFAPDLARVFNNLGTLYNDTDNYTTAIRCFRKARELRAKLYKANPEAYAAALASTMDNLGNTFKSINQYDSAVMAYSQARTLRTQLNIVQPEKYGPSLAITLNNLGILFLSINQYDYAKDCFIGAQEIYTQSDTDTHGKYDKERSRTYNNLGTLYSLVGLYDSALYFYKQGYNIRLILRDATPDSQNLNLAESLCNISGVYYIMNDLENTILYSKKGIESFEQIQSNSVKSTRFSLRVYLSLNCLMSTSYNEKIDSLPNLKETALLDLEQVIGFSDVLTYNSHTAWYIKIITESYSKILLYNKKPRSLSLRKNGHNKLAYGDTLSAITILQSTVNEYENQFKQDTLDVIILQSMAQSLRTLVEIGPDSSRFKYANKETYIRSQIYERIPDNYYAKRSLAESYAQLSWQRLLAQDYEGAKEAAKHGLEIDNNQHWLYSNLSSALLLQGKWKKAKAIYTSFSDLPYENESGQSYRDIFLRDLNEIEKAGITHPDMAKARALLEETHNSEE